MIICPDSPLTTRIPIRAAYDIFTLLPNVLIFDEYEKLSKEPLNNPRAIPYYRAPYFEKPPCSYKLVCKHFKPCRWKPVLHPDWNFNIGRIGFRV